MWCVVGCQVTLSYSTDAVCLFGNLSVYTVKVPGTTDYLVQDKLHLKVVFLVKFGILSLRDETLDAGALSNQVFHSMDQWSPVSRMCLSMVESPAPLKRGSVSQKQLKTEAQDIACFTLLLSYSTFPCHRVFLNPLTVDIWSRESPANMSLPCQEEVL